MYKEIKECRICSKPDLITVLSLGQQFLSGVFPKSPDKKITEGPLDLVWCTACGLLQMKQSYNLEEMYGDNYGYRSGLNASMVEHLQQKVYMLEQLVTLEDNDTVIDIGSNDATLLNAYTGDLTKVGIDPTGGKFRKYYTDDIILISEFFSKEVFRKNLPDSQAKIITSIAMFYDLEDPVAFVKDIASILADDGIWHFEQSYMPSMLQRNAYDTICHEHLEFYSFTVVKNLVEACGLRIIDVQMNSINGGSFAVTVCKHNAPYVSNTPIIDCLLKQEGNMNLGTLKPYRDFEERVFSHRKNIIRMVESLIAEGKKIIGYGASTKGNVLLQFCGLTSEHIPYIAEVNEEKFGAYTPGTHIKIISEKDAYAMNPDYFFVLPWHFKNSILDREKEYIRRGGKFFFPLPEIEVI